MVSISKFQITSFVYFSAVHLDAFTLYRIKSSTSVLQTSFSFLQAAPFTQNLNDRFGNTATTSSEIDQPCLFKIHNKTYDLTAWAKAHPGGVKVLQKFHNKDATKAFEAAGHSDMAYQMLRDFEILDADCLGALNEQKDVSNFEQRNSIRKTPRWKAKLFTKEDQIGIHKYAGIFVLLHYIFRFNQLLFGDVSAGFGSRLGKGTSIVAPLCLIPHLILSLSSLIFHTVPRERVVGKPMIWAEFRMHNIAFACRSILVTFLGWLSVSKNHSPVWRRSCIVVASLSILVTNLIADNASSRLRVDERESTTATMPYWDDCSIDTQKRFKKFYAYCQFMATLACLAMWNPAWGFAVMLPIQLASLLMTLVRKGILSARGYHIGYTISLCLPYFVGFRSVGYKFVPILGLGWLLFQCRRRGIGKYSLWSTVVVLRILFLDSFIDYSKW
jgi:Cytochrome b5-like Heme/Steroid binding domain